MKIIWTTSNIISFSRLLLSLPLAFSIWNELHILTVILVLIAYVSDLADGYFARKYQQISEFGKMIDPIADKVFINTAAIVLIAMGKIPLWFAVAVIVRDLIILLGGLFAKKKLKYVIPSNYTGKVTVIVIGIAVLGIILDISFIVEYGLYTALFFMFLSLLVYANTMIKSLNQAKNR